MRALALFMLAFCAPAFSQHPTFDTIRLAPDGANAISLLWGNDSRSGLAAVHGDALNVVIRNTQTQVWADWGTSLGGPNQRVTVGLPFGQQWWGSAYVGQTFEVASNNNSSGGATFSYWNAFPNQNAVLAFKKSLSDEIGRHAAVPVNAALGQIIAAGSDGETFIAAADILFESDSVSRPGVVPGRIVMRTADTAGVLQNRLAIRTDGVIEIGRGQLFVDSAGALNYRGPNGTVTVIGAP